jgi:hypothetical protein
MTDENEEELLDEEADEEELSPRGRVFRETVAERLRLNGGLYTRLIPGGE